MRRISTMNLMLHGVDAPDVRYLDSISKKQHRLGQVRRHLGKPPV